MIMYIMAKLVSMYAYQPGNLSPASPFGPPVGRLPSWLSGSHPHHWAADRKPFATRSSAPGLPEAPFPKESGASADKPHAISPKSASGSSPWVCL
eukprot:12725289-Prorocentrum_lima.AAC.1